MKYFDTHCHIQFPQYDADRNEVVQRLQEAEVGGLIVGVDAESSEQAIELVRKISENLTLSEKNDTQASKFFASVGLHPNDTDQGFDVERFEKMLQQPEVSAVGECGLDYYRPSDAEAVKKIQKEIFEQQIQLAVKYDKPLMIHSRPSKGTQDAYHDTIDMLTSKKREYGERLRGDMHFFVGGVEEAKKFIELDFSMSYTAVLTFTHDYDEVVRYIPLSHLLSETDSPFIAPASKRGNRNEPAAVIDVISAFARIRGEDEEIVRQAILQNSCQKLSFSL
jgi:TatD DNase family protein